MQQLYENLEFPSNKAQEGGSTSIPTSATDVHVVEANVNNKLYLKDTQQEILFCDYMSVCVDCFWVFFFFENSLSYKQRAMVYDGHRVGSSKHIRILSMLTTAPAVRNVR